MADALLPLREVTQHLRVLGEHYVGLREIPIDQIVGSVDRSIDFDRFFRTRRKDLGRRLDALRAAFDDRPLPPITVYEAGGLYFVVDGHHRVAYRKLKELQATDRGATWEDAAAILAATPVQRSHRMGTLAARRKPLPTT